MARKNSLLFLAGISFSIITFFGCGGKIDFSSLKDLQKKTQMGKCEISYSGFPSMYFNDFLSQIIPIESDYGTYKQVTNSLAQGISVNLTLEYNNLNPSFYHAIIKSNNKPVGENFICTNTNKMAEITDIELLNRVTAKVPGSKVREVRHKNYFSFDLIWSKYKKPLENSIIIDSLKNNPFNATQDYKYTVNFTLQKPIGGNYKLSNIQVSGLSIPQIELELKDSKDQSISTLQPTLTTLFANFEKSKEIFN